MPCRSEQLENQKNSAGGTVESLRRRIDGAGRRTFFVGPMRIFAISDLHVEYDENARWLDQLSRSDHVEDTVIVAGDISDELGHLAFGFRSLVARFRRVLYAPGNHELWLSEACGCETSLEKFDRVCELAADHGILLQPLCEDGLSIVPMLAWYDFSFGLPDERIRARWMDFRRCRWPAGIAESEITEYFLGLNKPAIVPHEGTVITFSHFLPRIDVMPTNVPVEHRGLYAVLGTARLDEQVRNVGSVIHIYGHSHLNRDVVLDGIRYVNNAFGYPDETHIAAKRLLQIY